MSGYIPEGFRALTAYPVVDDAPGLIAFVIEVFSAEETFRTVAPSGMHAELRIGDSMLMIGGGGQPRPMAFHICVPDVDAIYHRALAAGAVSLDPPANQFWGERTANVSDPFGNRWYIATVQGDTWFHKEFPVLQPYLHPPQVQPVIDFLHHTFGAQELGRYTSPDGKIVHTTVRFTDATLEMVEVADPAYPLPGTFYLYVPDTDATYQTALAAGAHSLSVPADQPYGERNARIVDPFGNRWFIATHLAAAASA